MSNMECPFCQQELRQDQDGFYTCYTDNCGCMKYGGNGASGSESLWLALIRTRKALDVLLFTINRLENQNYKDCAWHLRLAIAKIEATDIANKALEQITALEQKE